MSWEIRSSFLKNVSSFNSFKQLREVVSKERNISTLSLQPCMQISSYLDHANQFWQSNRQNIYLLLPQKDTVISMRMPATENFNLLDQAASYTLEVSAKLGLCNILQALRKITGDKDQLLNVEYLEPTARDQRIEVRQRRSFYSLQFQDAIVGINGSIIKMKRKEDNLIVVQSNIEATASNVNIAKSGENSAPKLIDVSLVSEKKQDGRAFNIQQNLFSTSIVQLNDASDGTNNEPFVLAGTSPAAFTNLPLSRRDPSDLNAKRIDVSQPAGLRVSIKELGTTIFNHIHRYSRIQLPYSIPKLHQKQMMYISYPEPLSTLDHRGSGDMSLSFPHALLQVPGIQFAAVVDGNTLYDLNLSGELKSILQRNSTAPKQIKRRWIDATRDFIQFAAQYEVSELTRRYPQLATPQVILSVEDFLPSFLESQIYLPHLFDTERQLSIVTLPDLLEGWHHIEVFATVPTEYLRYKLLSSINHAVDRNHILDLSVPSIVAFDSVRFQVVKSKSTVVL